MRPVPTPVLIGLSLILAGCASEPKLTYNHPCELAGQLRMSGGRGDRVFRAKEPGVYDWYPRRALELGKDGTALVRCSKKLDGPLHCDVVDESPAGLGFGAAAAKLAEKGVPDPDWTQFYRWTALPRRRCLPPRVVY
jgi:hypothetical protein